MSDLSDIHPLHIQRQTEVFRLPAHLLVPDPQCHYGFLTPTSCYS